MVLTQVFNPESIVVNLENSDKDSVFEELVHALIKTHPELDESKILTIIREREAKMSTGIMPGIAFPHGKSDDVKGVIGAIGISKNGIDYDSFDDKPVNLVFLIISSTSNCEYHLSVLTCLSALLKKNGFVEEMLAQNTSEDVYSVLCRNEKEL